MIVLVPVLKIVEVVVLVDVLLVVDVEVARFWFGAEEKMEGSATCVIAKVKAIAKVK